MRLEIPMIPPSGNELRRKYRTVFAYRDLRMAWEKALKICTGSAMLTGKLRLQAVNTQCYCKKLRIEVTVYRAKVLDDDNLMAGMKPILDAMKNLVYILDDSPHFIELPLPKQVISRKRRTIIEITPA